MGQTIVFEADRESPLTETQIRRLGGVLRSLLEQDDGFGRLRVEIEADSALDLAFAPEEEFPGPGLSEAVEEAETEPEEERTRMDEESEAEERETEEEPSLEELRERHKENDELPTINPGTRRYTLASVLYHADGYLTTPEIVELSPG